MFEDINLQQIFIELLWIAVLAVYAFIVIYSTKKTYEWFIKKGVKKHEAIYYNRKLIHIFAGGVISLFVPFVFTSPWYPLLCGLGLTVFTFGSHKGEKTLYWFQTEKDFNDVNFCLMWGVTIFVLWIITNNPWIAIIPSAFMALGDGITGIVRNLAFRERSKHPIGNLYMVCVCLPLGYYLFVLGGRAELAVVGVIAAIVASVVERYEIGPLDDNILITIGSSVVIYLGLIFGPMILS